MKMYENLSSDVKNKASKSIADFKVKFSKHKERLESQGDNRGIPVAVILAQQGQYSLTIESKREKIHLELDRPILKILEIISRYL